MNLATKLVIGFNNVVAVVVIFHILAGMWLWNLDMLASAVAQ